MRTETVEGLKELDAALGELPKATARNVLRRTLLKAGEVIAERARELAPDDPMTRANDLKRSIAVGTKLKKGAGVGASEFAAVMRAGGTRSEARQALLEAKSAAGSAQSFAEAFVGPTGRWGSLGHLQEFGTANHGPRAFMRPAFDGMQSKALDIIKNELKGEIEKAAARHARKLARAAARG